MTPQQIKTMTSIEVAELTGKNHKNVLRDIRTMIAGFEASISSTLSPLKWYCESDSYIDDRGRGKLMFRMDKETTLTLLSGYDVVARHKIIQRWQQLETTQQAIAPAPYYLPQTKAEALRALAEEIEAHEATQLQLDAAKPKVEQYDRTMNADGKFTVAETARLIGTGQNRLFDFLREQNIFHFRNGHNQPYQQYADNGWFVVIHKTYLRGGKEESYPQVFVTPKGVEGVRKKWDTHHRPPGNDLYLGNQPGIS